MDYETELKNWNTAWNDHINGLIKQVKERGIVSFEMLPKASGEKRIVMLKKDVDYEGIMIIYPEGMLSVDREILYEDEIITVIRQLYGLD